MAGRAGGRMAFGQGVRGVLGMFDGGSAPSYSEMEASQQSFLERMNAGEEISDDELADAPAGHVPEQLMGRRTTAQFSRMVSASMSSGGAGAGGSGPPPVVQPGGASSGPPMPPSVPPPADGGNGASGNGEGSSPGTAIAGFAGGLIKATVPLVAFVKGLDLMNTAVLSLNRGLSQYDGNLAQAYAQYDVDEMQRDIRRADTMSGPLKGLLKEQSEFRDSTAEVSDQVGAGFAQLLTAVTSGVNYLNNVMGLTDKVAEGIKSIREKIFGIDEEDFTPSPWQAFFADASDGKFDGKRPDFGGPKDIFPKKP
jgi:hypothetical protein